MTLSESKATTLQSKLSKLELKAYLFSRDTPLSGLASLTSARARSGSHKVEELKAICCLLRYRSTKNFIREEKRIRHSGDILCLLIVLLALDLRGSCLGQFYHGRIPTLTVPPHIWLHAHGIAFNKDTHLVFPAKPNQCPERTNKRPHIRDIYERRFSNRPNRANEFSRTAIPISLEGKLGIANSFVRGRG
ncbi:hypothetical protein Salat_2992200 [Sesamum alatum]|uniref:Uncharacterized protein n=1 Tax=Sesamum alatum TaxID=300844 RepID=A0AAE1XHT0_9LAMI|nr:hypothetical protein Salat_2992200 [Sesamum alatum]